MTDQQHPITPPPELVQQWLEDSAEDGAFGISHYIATQAARWGWEQRGAANEAELQKARDEELEACCKLLELSDSNAREFLTASRRPAPPSLKAQALERCNDYIDPDGIIRRALESLSN